MNVLWLRAEYPLPLDSGSKKRTYNLLQHCTSDASVVYLGFVSDERFVKTPALGKFVRKEQVVHRPRERKEGFGFYSRVFSNLGSPQPYFMKRNTDYRIKALLREQFREEKFDLMVCDGLDMAANIDFSLPVPKILMTHGLETTLWQQRYETAHGQMQRAYFNYETKRMAAYESDMCNKFDLILAVSQRDKERLESEFRVRVPIEVVETGVDCSYFRPNPDIPVVPHRLVFTGSIDLLSNIDGLLWFAAEVYPAVKKQYADVTLDIIGPDPASEIRALAQKDQSVRVTGWVEDVRPYLAAAQVFIVPLRAPGGTRVKIYEAMGMKTPVVSTTYGGEGLSLVHGVNLLIADTAREFADAVIELLGNEEKRQTVAENGWRMVNEKYDWGSKAKRLVEICRQLIEPSASD